MASPARRFNRCEVQVEARREFPRVLREDGSDFFMLDTYLDTVGSSFQCVCCRRGISSESKVIVGKCNRKRVVKFKKTTKDL